MSTEKIELVVDARRVDAAAGVSVASALFNAGIFAFRRSESGEARAPLCGMGVCYECRVTIDGVPHRRACMTTATHGMRIDTAAAAGEGR